MANKNRNLIIAYFPDADEAEKAAKHLRKWDKATKNVKLGAVAILTVNEKGKLKTRKIGARAGGTGAKWGTILGVTAGILSGGITLIGGAVVGLAAGSVAGALFHKHIGMEDHDKERLTKHLKDGGAALAVMADDDEVNPTKEELASLSGDVESYFIPAETADELEAAADAANVEEADEAILDEGDAEEDAAAAAITAAAAAEIAEDSEVAGPIQAVIHYHRHDGEYDGWELHVWAGHEGEVAWEAPIPPAGMDDFGIYFSVPMAEGASELGYIIHKGDEKDLWDDQVLDIDASGNEVWILQNTPGYIPAPGSTTDEDSATDEDSNDGEAAANGDDA